MGCTRAVPSVVVAVLTSAVGVRPVAVGWIVPTAEGASLAGRGGGGSKAKHGGVERGPGKLGAARTHGAGKGARRAGVRAGATWTARAPAASQGAAEVASPVAVGAGGHGLVGAHDRKWSSHSGWPMGGHLHVCGARGGLGHTRAPRRRCHAAFPTRPQQPWRRTAERVRGRRDRGNNISYSLTS
jgi:hypothetical protein